MAMTRRNAMMIDEARSRIKTSQIVNRLQGHIFSKWKMSESQVRAALGLLRKVIPDLANVELQAGDGGPILIVTGIMRPGVANPLIEHNKTAQVIEHAPAKAETASVELASQVIDKPNKLEHELDSTHNLTHDDVAKPQSRMLKR